MDEQRTKELILWFAMAFSIVMYAVVTLLIPTEATGDQGALVTALSLVAFGVVAASLQIRKRTPDQWKGFIVALALCESAALFGLVLWFIAASQVAYVLMGLGLAGLLLHFPKSGD